ncbi:MAG TPA: hypothetical protein VD833_26055 [Vicinamibacterales bacterium]|nr:hypothetical protein [Vicinamibacterales bacterium]
MVPRSAAVFAVVLGLTTAVAGGRQRFTREDADRFQSKLTRIVEFGNAARARSAAAPRQTTPLTDTEVNAFLRHHAKSQIPVGIVEPTLSALGEGRVGGRALVDLDAVRTQKQRGWMDPLAYLTGRLPVTARGRLHTEDGVGRFELESAEISGISVPKSVLQELLAHYSRSPENPSGISMDDPFELPSRIREIKVGKGEAVVVQ